MRVIFIIEVLLIMQAKLYTHFYGSRAKQLSEVTRDFLSFWKDFALVRVLCKMSALYRIRTRHFIFECLC